MIESITLLKSKNMNKQELNDALRFIEEPDGELQVIFYAVINDEDNPLKLDIKGDDLPELRNLFVTAIKNQIINKDDYVVLPLSSADERGKCFYQYDLDLPPELILLESVIGNDTLQNLNFNSNQLADIDSLIIVLADNTHEISLLKKLSAVEVLGRGGCILWKSNERLERFNDQMLRISSRFQIMRVENEIVIIDLDSIEKSFGFHDVITREATASLSVIENLNIVSNMDSLTELVGNVRFARKLTKAAKTSPIIRLQIPNNTIIEFARKYPLTKAKMRFSEDGTQFNLDTNVSKDLFIKILNDDLLTSELTRLYYDSLAKDGIEIEEESTIEENNEL